jgi:hypothetical protein
MHATDQGGIFENKNACLGIRQGEPHDRLALEWSSPESHRIVPDQNVMLSIARWSEIQIVGDLHASHDLIAISLPDFGIRPSAL